MSYLRMGIEEKRPLEQVRRYQPSRNGLDCGEQVVNHLGALRVRAPRRTAASTPALLACVGCRPRLLSAHLVAFLLRDGQHFDEIEANDREEDRLFGKVRGDELPEWLDTAEKRLEAIK